MIATLAAAAVYLLALDSIDPWDAAFGLAASAGLVRVLRGRLPGPAGRRPSRPPARLLALPGLVGAVLLEIVRGSWDVGLRVAHLRPFDSAGLVAVPIGERSPRGVAVTGLLAGLSPGSVLVDVDAARHEMLFHVADAADPDAVRDRIDGFYERHQRQVWP